MYKIREAMKSSESQPMDGDVHVDEFVVGGKEVGKPGRSYGTNKKKAVCAVQLTKEGKVKRLYIKKIEDFSLKSLQDIFDRHISKEANVVTDEWRGYLPIAKGLGYKIGQTPSNKWLNFKALHTMIHQLKSWIRTIHSWVSAKQINRHFSEFCYRINRSQMKESIFHNLVRRMVNGGILYRKQIVCS